MSVFGLRRAPKENLAWGLLELSRARPVLTMEGTNGARIPPTLHDMEQTPKPAFLKHKNMYKHVGNV